MILTDIIHAALNVTEIKKRPLAEPYLSVHK